MLLLYTCGTPVRPLARQLMRSGLPCSCLAWRVGQRGAGGSRGGGTLACEAQQVPDRLRLPFLSICASIIICIQCVCTSIFIDLVHRLQLISEFSTQAA